MLSSSKMTLRRPARAKSNANQFDTCNMSELTKTKEELERLSNIPLNFDGEQMTIKDIVTKMENEMKAQSGGNLQTGGNTGVCTIFFAVIITVLAAGGSLLALEYQIRKHQHIIDSLNASYKALQLAYQGCETPEGVAARQALKLFDLNPLPKCSVISEQIENITTQLHQFSTSKALRGAFSTVWAAAVVMAGGICATIFAPSCKKYGGKSRKSRKSGGKSRNTRKSTK
jgi:hypothetical protein